MALPATPATAQAVYGSIAGTVADSRGARAPGASLTITSLDRGTVDTVTSNASGYYLAFVTDQIPIGRILDHLGLRVPEQNKPPPPREILRVAEVGEGWGLPSDWP